MSRHYWPVWGFLMDRTQHSSFLEITSTLTTSITFFPATLSFHITSSTSPSQQKFACRIDFLRNRFIGCPMAGMVMLFLSTCFRYRGAEQLILPGSSMTDILTAWDRVGDGRVTHVTNPTSTLTTSITFFPATLSFHITSSTSPSQQKFACRIDFLRNRFIGCPMAGMVMLFLSTCFRYRGAEQLILPGSSMTDILTAWDRVGDGRVTHVTGPTSLHKTFLGSPSRAKSVKVRQSKHVRALFRQPVNLQSLHERCCLRQRSVI